MKTTGTIDERIRENARRELRDAIEKTTKAYRQELTALVGAGYGGVARTSMPRPGDTNGKNTYWISELLDVIVEASFTNGVERAEDAAITTFLSKVDNLQSELDAIRQEIPANA